MAEPALRVVRVEGASHFVTLDRPDAIPALQPDDEQLFEPGEPAVA